MRGESDMETYITICKTDSQWEPLYGSGTQTRALYRPRGWDGAGDGREAQKGGDVCIPVAESC